MLPRAGEGGRERRVGAFLVSPLRSVLPSASDVGAHSLGASRRCRNPYRELGQASGVGVYGLCALTWGQIPSGTVRFVCVLHGGVQGQSNQALSAAATPDNGKQAVGFHAGASCVRRVEHVCVASRLSPLKTGRLVESQHDSCLMRLSVLVKCIRWCRFVAPPPAQVGDVESISCAA